MMQVNIYKDCDTVTSATASCSWLLDFTLVSITSLAFEHTDVVLSTESVTWASDSVTGRQSVDDEWSDGDDCFASDLESDVTDELDSTLSADSLTAVHMGGDIDVQLTGASTVTTFSTAKSIHPTDINTIYALFRNDLQSFGKQDRISFGVQNWQLL